jgi:hypothetical protein
VRGTRIRWDGALKAVGLGLAILVALLVLPGLLGGEPPPPPADVGLVAAPPPPPAPAPAPAPAAKPPKPPGPDPGKGEGRPERKGRDVRAREGRKRARTGEEESGTAATAIYVPPATIRESFGFER